MKMIRYPARIHPDPEAPENWLAVFPGLGGSEIMTCGNSPDEARQMASECLSAYVLSKLDAGEGLDPVPDLPDESWEWVYPEPQIEVALAIKELRKQAALTQQQAAERLGVAQATYNRWEDPDKCNATVRTLEKIARAFGKRLEVVFR